MDYCDTLRAQHYNATILSIRYAHPDLMVLCVRPDFEIPPYKAGQYTTLGLGFWEPRLDGSGEEHLKPGQGEKLVKRAYSLSSPLVDAHGSLFPANDEDFFEFYITLVHPSDGNPAPTFTPRLFRLREGDRLHVGEKITGHYTLEALTPGTDLVLFGATGTGEAPNNRMIWDLLWSGHEGRIVSAVCTRYRKDLAYETAHRQLEQQFPQYQYIVLTTREAENVGQKVYLQDLIRSGQLEDLIQANLDPSRSHVFLCGNPAMIGSPKVDKATGEKTYPAPVGVTEVLETDKGFTMDQGKRRGNIHVEEYW